MRVVSLTFSARAPPDKRSQIKFTHGKKGYTSSKAIYSLLLSETGLIYALRRCTTHRVPKWEERDWEQFPTITHRTSWEANGVWDIAKRSFPFRYNYGMKKKKTRNESGAATNRPQAQLNEIGPTSFAIWPVAVFPKYGRRRAPRPMLLFVFACVLLITLLFFFLPFRWFCGGKQQQQQTTNIKSKERWLTTGNHIASPTISAISEKEKGCGHLMQQYKTSGAVNWYIGLIIIIWVHSTATPALLFFLITSLYIYGCCVL